MVAVINERRGWGKPGVRPGEQSHGQDWVLYCESCKIIAGFEQGWGKMASIVKDSSGSHVIRWKKRLKREEGRLKR